MNVGRFSSARGCLEASKFSLSHEVAAAWSPGPKRAMHNPEVLGSRWFDVDAHTRHLGCLGLNEGANDTLLPDIRL